MGWVFSFASCFPRHKWRAYARASLLQGEGPFFVRTCPSQDHFDPHHFPQRFTIKFCLVHCQPLAVLILNYWLPAQYTINYNANTQISSRDW